MWTTYKTLLFFIPPLARFLFQVPWHVTKRDDNATAQSWGASDSSEQLNYDKNAFRFIICFISLKTKFSCVYWINFSSNVSHKNLPDTFPPFLFWVIDCRRLLRITKAKLCTTGKMMGRKCMPVQDARNLPCFIIYNKRPLWSFFPLSSWLFSVTLNLDFIVVYKICVWTVFILQLRFHNWKMQSRLP